MISNLYVGQKLTIFTIDSILAMTHRRFIEIRAAEKEPRRVGYDNNLRLGTYREQGKRRKEFFLDLPSDALVFDGWEVPFTADTDGGGMISGNACFNLVGDPAVIRDWIETKQLNSEVGDDRNQPNISLAGSAGTRSISRWATIADHRTTCLPG